ncbi:MAG: Serine/threonine-protein kinase StkP [Chlamydiae bacterium]|nr:Serine/threonine-protein kinase StkP [Chlamydiota bacterium]
MSIQNTFSSFVNLFAHHNADRAVADNNASQQQEIPRETLSRAILDKQPDGALRWRVLNRFGSPECRTFKSEECLDHYLSQNGRVDIWEIEDQRCSLSKTIYKWCDPDETFTYTSKDELYRELASATDHRVFCIHDLNTREERYIRQQKGWLHTDFEEVALEKALETLLFREKTLEQRCQTTALGLAALATLAGMIGIGRTVKRGWQELTTTVSLSPNPLAKITQTLDKTATFVFPALVAYGMHSLSKSPGSLFPAAQLAILTERGFAAAQSCPQFAGWYNTPGAARDVAISGNYAYVADANTGGLQIIDVSNVTNPVRVGWYDTPGEARGVAVSGSYAYVADGNSGLQIIDVSNVTNPVRVDWYDTPGYAEEVVVSGSYAYVADAGFGLQIIDVSNATNPIRVGWYNTPDYARGVAVSGSYAYVADVEGLQIIDVSNITNLVRVGWYNTPGQAFGVAVSGNYAYVADDNVGGLQIIDVSNVANPVRAGWYNTPWTWGVAVSGSYAYVACAGFGLQIVDVSNVANPVPVNGYDTPDRARDVALFGNHAYVADDDGGGLQIIDISCLLNSSTTSSSATRTTTNTSSTSLPSSSTQAGVSQSRTISSWTSSSVRSYTNTFTSQSSTVFSNTLVQTFSPTTTQPLSTGNASDDQRSVWIGLGLGIAGVVCLGATGTTLFYLLRKEKAADSSTDESFELEPTIGKAHKIIGKQYYQLSHIRRKEAEEIYRQTGYLITIPEGQKKVHHKVGSGHFGAIKVAQRIKDSQYVASKKVKGEENVRESELEANMQKEAAGENVLPIYNTISLEETLYHFMPLAGLGDGSAIQGGLSALDNPKLAVEILKFIAKDLLTGLRTIHQKGIYHLDIKPNNMVFTKDGTGYITDFGCAKKAEDKQVPSDSQGDNHYFSPERLQAYKDKNTFDGEKTDIWSAGMMLLQMIKGKEPLQLFEMPRDFSHRVYTCTKEYFLEKLDLYEELRKPDEWDLWWVIKGLLDPNPKTRLSADEALQASCFKGLSDTTKQHVFEDLSTAQREYNIKTEYVS